MNTNFDYFTFSIFIGCDFTSFTETVKSVRKEYIEDGKGKIVLNTILNLKQYINPDIGSHLEHFSWWQSELYPSMVFLSSNQGDGLEVPCRLFQDKLKCICIKICVSLTNDYPKNSFWYIGENGKERIVMALKEDKWTFFQMGTPLPFEDVSLYEKKRIKDRINFDIIKQYLSKIGIDYDLMDSNVVHCASFEKLKLG